MKHFFTISIILLTSLFSEEIQWVNNWNEALQKGKNEHKLIMLVVSQEHCGACEFFKDVTLEDDKVIQEVNSFYIPINLDINEIPKNLYVRGTPTTRFYTPKGKKIRYKIVGGLSAKQLLPRLRKLRKLFYKRD